MRRIGVGGAGCFEGESDVLAASWGAGPVDEFVGGIFGGLLAFGWLRSCHFGCLVGSQMYWGVQLVFVWVQ